MSAKTWLIGFGAFLISVLTNGQSKRVVVALDGSGDFVSIQAAINSLKDHSPERLTIFIRKGTYREKLVVWSWKTKVSMIGESRDETRIVFDDHSGKGAINTFTSYTVLVQGNDFYAENITFENNAGRDVGQAVALHVEADRCVFRNCGIKANQDTLYVGVDNSRQYYKDCIIEGTTDFIFGPATVVFENCTVISKKNSYITAASTPEGKKFGLVFFHCNLRHSPEALKVYLGRPWRPFAKTVFIQCEMDDHIVPEGWHNWNKPDAEKTSFYAEYQSTGKGAHPGSRVAWSRQLNDDEARGFTLKGIFPEWEGKVLP